MHKSVQYGSFRQETLTAQNNNTENEIMYIIKGTVVFVNII